MPFIPLLLLGGAGVAFYGGYKTHSAVDETANTLQPYMLAGAALLAIYLITRKR
jgi:hypothetical protein